MKRSMKKTLIMHGVKLIALGVNVMVFWLFWWLYYRPDLIPESTALCIVLPLSYAVIITLLVRIYNAFEIGMAKVSEVIYSLFLSDIIASVVTYMISCISCFKILTFLPVIGILAIQLIWNVLWALAANRLYFFLYAPKKTAIVYKEDKDLIKLEEMQYFESKFCVQKRIKNPKDIHQIMDELEDCRVVFVSGIEATLRNGILKHCVENGLQSYVVPHVGDIILAGANHLKMVSVPVMQVHRAEPHPEYLFIKRVFDIVASLAAILIASPFMMITALAIKLYDGGPVFYKQLRVTKDGKEFEIIKFRSMNVNAEKDGIARLASENDSRITPVGNIIRKIRFDELPQLINILRGDMSFVGPRPERPEIIRKYQTIMPAFCLRLQAKAGLTGYAQVYGRYNTELDDKLKMDLMYINNMSVVEDLKLMFATVKILFMSESTKGVSNGQTIAMSGGNVEISNFFEKTGS